MKRIWNVPLLSSCSYLSGGVARDESVDEDVDPVGLLEKADAVAANRFLLRGEEQRPQKVGMPREDAYRGEQPLVGQLLDVIAICLLLLLVSSSSSGSAPFIFLYFFSGACSFVETSPTQARHRKRGRAGGRQRSIGGGMGRRKERERGTGHFRRKQ